VDEKEVNHPAHPMDRMANWCSHEGWFTLALKGNATMLTRCSLPSLWFDINL